MNCALKFSFIVALSIMSVICPTAIYANTQNVLILLSDSAPEIWNSSIVNSIKKCGTPPCVNFEVILLKDNVGIEAKNENKEKNILLKKIGDKHYNAILTTSYPAYKFIKDNFSVIKKGQPLISIGCENYNSDFIKDNPNVIAIKQEFSFKENLELALQLFPKTSNITILADSEFLGETSKQNLDEAIKSLVRDGSVNINILDSDTQSTGEMFEYISRLPKNSVIFFISWNSHNNFDFQNITEQISIVSKCPILASIGGNRNTLGGYVSYGSEHGNLAALIIKDILKGNAPDSLKNKSGSVKKHIDKIEARKYGIGINLPKGFIFINEVSSYSNTLKVQLWILAFSFVLFLLALVLYFTKRRNIKLSIEAIYKNMPISLSITDKNGNISFIHSNMATPDMSNIDQLMGDIGSKFRNKIEYLSRSENTATEFDYSISDKFKHALVRKLPQKIFGKDQYALMAIDISESHATQEILKRYVKQEQTLNKYLKQIVQNHRPEIIIRELLIELRQQLGADRIFIYLLDDAKKKLVRQISWDVQDEKIPRLNSIDIGEIFDIVQTVLSRGVQKCEDILDNPTPDFKFIQADLANIGIKSIITTGIRNGDNLEGIIGVDYIKKVKKFTKLDEQILKSAASVFEIIKERMDYSEKIKQAEFERTTIINSIDVPAIVFDLDMRILAENPAAHGMAQYIPGRMLKVNCPCVLKQEVCLNDACIFRNCIRHKKDFSGEVYINKIPYMATAKPIFDNNGVMNRILCTLINMSEFNERKRQMEAAIEAEKASNRAKSIFLATMSHEIRTPLNAIIGYAELSQDTNVSESERCENLKNIRFSADALLLLINDILDISKLESGNIEIFRTATNIEKLIRNIARIFALRIERKKLQLQFDIQEGIPLLMLDSKRLRQAVINIMGNAVKFTTEGHIKVIVRYSEQNLYIAIEDTGVGIAEAYREKIFNPFEQQPDIRVEMRKEGGTGLGLSISKKLAAAMNGEIKMVSQLNKGSTFTLILKDVELAKDKTDFRRIVKNPDKINCDITKHTALIVDDVPMNLKVLSSILGKLGVHYHACQSAAEALKMFDYCTPTIVLTDIWMPEENGDIMVEKIRLKIGLQNLPIIAITADIKNENISGVFDDIILKPITPLSIKEILQKYPPDTLNKAEFKKPVHNWQ